MYIRYDTVAEAEAAWNAGRWLLRTSPTSTTPFYPEEWIPTGVDVVSIDPDPGILGRELVIEGTGFLSSGGTVELHSPDFAGTYIYPTVLGWSDTAITISTETTWTAGGYGVTVYNSYAQFDSITAELIREEEGFFRNLFDDMTGLIVPEGGTAYFGGVMTALALQTEGKFPFSVVEGLTAIQQGYAGYSGYTLDDAALEVKVWGEVIPIDPPEGWDESNRWWKFSEMLIWVGFAFGIVWRFVPRIDT
jgi:hypothetical protein